jgi:hypothetical protein
MKLTTKQLKFIIKEELTIVLKEQRQIREMEQFFALSDKMLMLNEGKIADFLKKAPSWFSNKWNVIKDLAKAAKLGVVVAYKVFKANNGFLYKILSKVGWVLDKLWKLLKGAARIFAKLQQAAADAMAKFPVIKQMVDAGEYGAKLLDAWFDENPWMKKLAGPAVGGMLILIWLNMAFTGDWDYDFDQTAMLRAMQGDFKLMELFFSPDGKRLLMLLFTGGIVGLSFPWLSSASSGFKLVASILYTLGKEETGKTDTTVNVGVK